MAVAWTAAARADEDDGTRGQDAGEAWVRVVEAQSNLAGKRASFAEAQAVVERRKAALDLTRVELQVERAELERARADLARDAAAQSRIDKAQARVGALEKAEQSGAQELQQALDAVAERENEVSEADVALQLARQKHAEASKAGPENGCGESGKGAFCLMLGLFTATGSAALAVPRDGFEGLTSQQLVSFAVPFAGARWAVRERIALDLGLLTGVFNTDVSLNSGRGSSIACTKDAVTFEQKLPCEGDAHLRPYGALFIGPSVGNETLTYLAFYGVVGWARTDKDPSAGFFAGMMFGLVGLHETVAP